MTAESVLEGRDIYDWARLADELAEALFRLHRLGDAEIADRVLAKYESWRPARNDGTSEEAT